MFSNCHWCSPSKCVLGWEKGSREESLTMLRFLWSAYSHYYPKTMVYFTQWLRQIFIDYPFPSCNRFLMPLQQTIFENSVAKEEIAHDEQFLLLPQCVHLYTIIILACVQNFHIFYIYVLKVVCYKFIVCWKSYIFFVEDLSSYNSFRNRSFENIPLIKHVIFSNFLIQNWERLKS